MQAHGVVDKCNLIICLPNAIPNVTIVKFSFMMINSLKCLDLFAQMDL